MDIRYLFSKAGKKSANYGKMIERLMDDLPLPKIGFYQAAYNLADELIVNLGKKGSGGISEMNRQQIDYVASVSMGELVMGVAVGIQTKYDFKQTEAEMEELKDEDFKSPKSPFKIPSAAINDIKKTALKNVENALQDYFTSSDKYGEDKKPELPKIIGEQMDVIRETLQGENAENFIGYLFGFTYALIKKEGEVMEGDEGYDPKVDDPANYAQAEFDEDGDFSDEFTEANKMQKWFNTLRK